MSKETVTEADTFACFLRNKRFQFLSKSIYFDTEFQRLLHCFNDLKEVVDSIQKRQSMGDSLDLSTSKFQRIELEKNKHITPELVYRFRLSLDEIKVIRVRKQYFVYSTFPAFPTKQYRGIPHVYGGYDSLEPAVSLFSDTVHEYCKRRIDELF